MSRDSQEYKPGQGVVGRVEEALSYGAFVRLDDGTRAYIRRRELTWAGNVDPRELHLEGKKIEGVVIKLAEPGQCLELSHRATLVDPWHEFVAKFRPGDAVEGIVKNLLGYGAYVEIVPGIDGLIPLKELATWPVQEPDEVVWVGDTVEAIITHVDSRVKKLRLSIRARMRQLEVVVGIMEEFSLFLQTEPTFSEPGEVQTEDGVSDEIIGSEAEPDITLLKPKNIGCILVVDDYDEIRLPLVEWLRYRGYEVDEAADTNQANQKILEKSYSLLLVDLNLPGTDGLTWLRQLKQSGINCQAAIMSTAEWLAERSTEIEEIGVIEALVKPLDRDEIEHLLNRINQGEMLPGWQTTSRPTQRQVPQSFQQVAAVVRGKVLLSDQFRVGLKQLVTTTSAEMGLIFRLDPISRAITITTQIGKLNLNIDALHSLRASPIREVIEEGEHILEYQMSGQTGERFRKLLELLAFESCIGVPIEASGEIQRAVFLLHRQPKAFNRYHLRDALAMSVLFSVIIERQVMEERFRLLNKQLLNGELASGFGHEVSNKVSSLEFQLRNLQRDCFEFERREYQPDSFAEIRQAVDHLSSTFDDLKRTVELFQQPGRTSEEHNLCLNEIVQKVVSLIRPTLHKHKIKLEINLSPDLPSIAGGGLELQQVFLNIMLNAIHQMNLKPNKGKVLTVTTAYQDQERRPIKIRFSDTGPGIHRRLWERIFDLGFTTRLGGTGQGLYIARSLVESLGGQIQVERSVIPIGATFLVELPVIQS
ncbi:MAG TPA: S1 RNA-binding domain-containing protein [Anaerolineae bacterium]|nr:S1 RNA-binding domain-containing protein [Anaerolineae bacterium]